ncbi:MAG: hypothetical protein SOW08_03405, partial [Lachnospiraceae bacterium]|nr:hypothetical protein [Lachnospiraceae bacterium]
LSLLCLAAFGADHFIIPSMIAIPGILTLLRKPLEEKEAENPVQKDTKNSTEKKVEKKGGETICQ